VWRRWRHNNDSRPDDDARPHDDHGSRLDHDNDAESLLPSLLNNDHDRKRRHDDNCRADDIHYHDDTAPVFLRLPVLLRHERRRMYVHAVHPGNAVRHPDV
jgi:hypothetical protein